MAGRVDASRDLRLGLYALESGAIDQEQLVSAIRDWSRSPDRSLSEILASHGVLDATALVGIEDRVAREIEPPDNGPGPLRAVGTFTHDQPDRPGGTEATATVAYAGRSLSSDANDADHVTGPPAGPGIEAHRFRILGPHARGGLGEVFLAHDRELNRSVALKELQARSAHDPSSQARFLLEAEVTGSLEHPGIVPIYSLGRYADGRPYYAMRLIEGETLRAAIERFHRTGATVDGHKDKELVFRRLLGSVIDTCNAVAYAHSRGVVHRDLKPENIMIGRFGETLVIDWGIAKSFPGAGSGSQRSAPDLPDRPPADASLTRAGSVIGTPRYMSPEQAAGDLERVGPASDIYALGAILYCLLVGHDPFPDGDVPDILNRVRRGIFASPRRLSRSVDPSLEAICLKAMALDVSERHATALDLASDLEAWQADVRYRGEQAMAHDQAKGWLTRLCLERAYNRFDREARDEGMLWLARALENVPPEPPELQRVIRTSLYGWHAGEKLLERCLRHGGEVHAITFCPEGRRLATACGDRTARLWDVATGSPLSPPLRHGGPVRAVSFCPDGKTVATAGDDGKILRWDATTGEPVGGPLRCSGPVTALAFNPNGSRIAAVGAGGFSLWDVEAGSSLHKKDKHSTPVLAVAFSPDGTTIAVAGHDGVRLMEATTGRPLGEPLVHGSAVPVLTFDSGGQMLLTGCRDGSALLWDVALRATIMTLSHRHRGQVHCVGFRPGGGAYATAGEDGAARLWETGTGRPIGEPLAHRPRVDQMAFRPDGTMVATGGPDGTVRLWCPATGLPVGPPLTQGGAVRGLVFSQDGRRFATAGSDANVRCWQTPNPIEGGAERVSCWVRIMTNLEFDAGDAIRHMDGPTSWDLRRRLTDLGGAPVR